ncbi:hypothetical protein SAMN05421869_105173 [Nonomuraea jiangxiensis]|uniref:Uncharacterized protein n=1 Tax=Nonomuraea jiangxiensis TaxID=633440 RepID=A0A1G8JS45_9ACTN|nr:hypothetical protein SAMN05421869_105173 [Nonomuraea jiangxiensis]
MVSQTRTNRILVVAMTWSSRMPTPLSAAKF